MSGVVGEIIGAVCALVFLAGVEVVLHLTGWRGLR